MDYLYRIARSVLRLLGGAEDVVLVHGPTDRFFASSGESTADPALAHRFESTEAEAFVARYACDPEAWVIVPAAAASVEPTAA